MERLKREPGELPAGFFESGFRDEDVEKVRAVIADRDALRGRLRSWPEWVRRDVASKPN